MKPLSIKMKITLWHTGLILIILSAIFLIILFSTDKILVLALQNELEEEVYDAADDIKFKNGALDLHKLKFFNDGIHLSLYMGDATLLAGQVPASVSESAPPFRSEVAQTVKTPDHQWMVYDVYLTGKGSHPIWVRGVASLSSSYEMRNQILLACTALFPFLLLLAGWGGWLISKKAFRPISRIQKAVEDIERSGDLSKRIRLTGSKDEVYDLAVTFDHMLSRLETSFNMERQFTSDASHELRTPVSVILSHAEYALSNAENSREITQSLRVIERQAKKMSALIDCLLQLARADQKSDNLVFEQLDISAAAEIVIEEIEIAAAEKRIEIRAEIESGLIIIADQTSILRVLLNLLQNAIKYGRENGWIRLTLRAARDGIIGSVEDNGIGIAPENLPEIWKRFYQVDPSRGGAENAGAGLGLPIVKGIIQRHGGTITVSSAPDKGTNFQFTLPSVPPPKAGSSAKEE